MTEIKTVTAIPAGGKTHEVIELVNNSQDKFIIVNIGQKLADQTFNKITRSKAIAVSNTTGNSRVGAQIEQNLRNKVSVIVCCHQGFMKIDPTLLHGYTVIIDEVPSTINLGSIPVKDTTDILNILGNCCNIDGCKYTLHPDHGNDGIEAIKAQGTRSEKMESMLTALELGSTVTRMGDNEFRWSVVFNWVEHLQHADSIYMLAAQVEGLATTELMKAQGAVFVPSNDIKPKYSAYNNPKRTKVIPLLTGINYSRNRCVDGNRVLTLDVNGNYKPDGFTVYQQMRINAGAALKHYGKDRFIYTVNSNQENEKWDYGQANFVPYNPHGRNDLVSYEAVICIYQANLDNLQKAECNEIADKHGINLQLLEHGMINQIYHEPIFQAATRGIIRNHEDSDTTYVVIVPDERAANYLLNGHFKGAELVKDFAIDGNKVKLQQEQYERQQHLQSGEFKLTAKWLGIPPEHHNAFKSWKSKNNIDSLEQCINWMNKRNIPTSHLQA
ncbi:hypothetical protein PU634_04205 [Oceanimonas pelagia]|uniref:Uncharacterized protein n=1 Tax=Oceanimonas pelagia TaxID=3028314 RepID=A0AA50KQS2_9GAMM|nr:hypothetical protein [Oceanimonas pelagia]WMC11571.1 hypothetical protein PU634_04205 [Oceanimonas pelagia]